MRNINNGYAGGNNLELSIVAEVGFKYVWILNPDVELSKQVISNVFRNYQSFKADVLVCKIKDFLKRTKLQFNDYPREVHPVKFLSGSSIFPRIQVLLDVRFDESFFSVI